ncbi:MAG: hypothetical protein ACJ04P_09685 [Halioglobus sp.]
MIYPQYFSQALSCLYRRYSTVEVQRQRHYSRAQRTVIYLAAGKSVGMSRVSTKDGISDV